MLRDHTGIPSAVVFCSPSCHSFATPHTLSPTLQPLPAAPGGRQGVCCVNGGQAARRRHALPRCPLSCVSWVVCVTRGRWQAKLATAVSWQGRAGRQLGAGLGGSGGWAWRWRLAAAAGLGGGGGGLRWPGEAALGWAARERGRGGGCEAARQGGLSKWRAGLGGRGRPTGPGRPPHAPKCWAGLWVGQLRTAGYGTGLQPSRGRGLCRQFA